MDYARILSERRHRLREEGFGHVDLAPRMVEVVPKTDPKIDQRPHEVELPANVLALPEPRSAPAPPAEIAAGPVVAGDA
jgi:hypothetical protein